MKANKSAHTPGSSANRPNRIIDRTFGHIWVGRHHITLRLFGGDHFRLPRAATAKLKYNARALKLSVEDYVGKIVGEGLEKYMQKVEGGAS